MSTDLAVIEAALKAATPGPWQVYESIMADTFVYGPRGILRDDIIAGPTYNRENAHLIVLLRNSAAELVERVKVAEAAIERVRALHRPGPAFPDVRQVCADCDWLWPCPTFRALDGDAKRCTSDITLRDEEHCLCRCTLTGGHAGVHDDGAGTTWTGGDA